MPSASISSGREKPSPCLGVLLPRHTYTVYSMHTQWSSLFNSPLEAGGRIFGDGDVGVTGTPIHKRSPAAAADCLGLTLQDMWKLASLELVGFNLKVLLKQPWLISFLVVVCYLVAQALARARDARKPGDGRNRCAQGRASAALPRQKASLPRLGGAATPLRPMLVLCHLVARSACMHMHDESAPPPPTPPLPSYAFADMASLQTAVTAYNADADSATATYGPISSWGVSAVTNMNGLVSGLAQFNADISSWDTSSVTDMGSMFAVRSAPALPSTSTVPALPAACATGHPTPPSRLLARMQPLLLCFLFLLGRAHRRSTSR